MDSVGIRVDIVVPTGGYGGVEKVINTVARYLMNCGMKVRVIQMIRGMVKWLEEGIPYYVLFDNTKGQDTDTFTQGYASFLKMEGFPDIVLATNWPLMSKVCKQACEHEHVLVVSWIHNQIDRYEADQRGGLTSLAYADAHFAICKDIYNDIENYILKHNVYLVHNPVEKPEIQLSQSNHTNTLLYIGRIDVVKRIDFILMILGVCKNWNLKIIGSGEDKLVEGLKSLAEQINISNRIEWIGWTKHPWKEAENATALIMASEFEGFPMVALEASMVGLPVISTPVSGVNEYIETGRNGYLYQYGNLSEVAAHLLDIEDGLVNIPTPATCQKSAEPFQTEIICGNIRNILMSLLSIV